jgi:hypothetical protein
MKHKTRVRFNLSKGKNHMKWKITRPNFKPEYYSPEEVSITLVNCILKNYKSTALKIFNGAHKSVCAWILCDDVVFNEPCEFDETNQLRYNPRVTPHWVLKDEVVDECTFRQITSLSRKLFVI